MLVRLLAHSRVRLWSTNRVCPAQIVPSVAPVTNLLLRHSRDQSSGKTKGQFSRKSIQLADGSILRQFLYCFTILAPTKEPGELSSAELIARLPNLTDVAPQPGIPSVVLLLTPSLTHLLNESDYFLRDAVSRLFPGADTIKTVAAVVDRLPREQGSSSKDAGSEGLSILVTVSGTQNQSVYHLQSAGVAESAGPGPGEGRHISFYIPTKYNLHQLFLSYHHFQRIVLPLANTIFQNGQPSTLLSSRWSRAGHSRELQRIPSPGVEGLNVFLPSAFNEWRFASHIPLVSVTVPRRIVAGFGNIIRQISLDPIQTPEREANGNKEEWTDVPITTAVPASQELEGAVQAYFKHQGLQPHQVTIWALVTPQEHIPRDWATCLRVCGDNNIRDELRHWFEKPHIPGQPILMKFHDRLHRVLSGGGGWGKKQGLLALDPEISCGEREDVVSEFDIGDGRVVLGEIANPGDFVQFFIQQSMPQPIADESDVKSPQDAVVFGSIPSSVDAIPGECSSPPLGHHRQLEVIENQFGALCERGIVHQLVSYPISKYGRRGPQLRLPDPVAQTKIDVPYSKLYFYYGRRGLVRKVSS
ncbi:MAG: hypothetical protein M1839_001874 [Geoglossum umbratile]|nr:MAG: hypothetical protein M1839_001874 [Geoglossum umbratile]